MGVLHSCTVSGQLTFSNAPQTRRIYQTMGRHIVVRPSRFVALCGRTLSAAWDGCEHRFTWTRQLNVQTATAPGKYKTIDDLPGPSLATTVYWLFVKGYADKSHAMQVCTDML